jgi:hypothetical protein
MAAEIKKAGGKAEFVHCDVINSEKQERRETW